MNQLICIIGPDGTGKTTQINLLIENLKEKGLNYEYRWLRFYHFFSLPLLGLARLMGLSEVKILNNGEKIGYHYFYKSKLISRIYPVLLFIDTVIFTLIKVYFPMKILGKNIACDRFIYDTLIDIMISTKDYNIYKSKLGKFFLSLIPKDCNIIMLIADEKALKGRREDVFYDKNLILKINLYEQLAKYFEIPVIKAELPVKKIQNKIFELINLME